MLLTSVTNLPQHAPGLPAVVGTLPVPVEAALFDVVPDHSLSAFLAAHDGIPRQDHLPILECACEIEIRAVVIHPGLAPELALRVIGGNAHPMQVGPNEIFLDDLSVQNTRDAIGSFSIFAPCAVP